MDVTYTDADWHDVGILPVTRGDFAYGSSENDFQLILSKPIIPPIGAIVYSEDTEAGGIVRGYKTVSNFTSVTLTGDTWTGVINRKVIGPDSGSAYLTMSGDIRACVAQLITRAGLDNLFTVASYTPGVTVSHTFKGSHTDTTQEDAGRYMGCWTALWQLLTDHGCKCTFAWDVTTRHVIITVSAAVSHVDDEQTDVATVTVTKSAPINHLVCLGKGELAERAVKDVYLDANGKASTTQYYTGIDEIAETYESTQDEGDDLVSAGESKILDLAADAQTVEIDAPASVVFDLGDTVGGTDTYTGLEATAIVDKRIVTLDGDAVTVTYNTTMI